jgi:hypothetical protein
MNYSVKIVFGKEQVDKCFRGEDLTIEELGINCKVFSFDIESEVNAFCKGIDEAVGWTEYYIDQSVLDNGGNPAYIL